MEIKKKRCFLAVFMLLLLCGCSREKDSPPTIETAKIGTMIGSSGEAVVQEKYPKAENLRFNNYVDETAALAADKIDYALMDYATAWNYSHYNKDFYILPNKLTDDKTALALNKNNTELNKKINEIVNRYLSNGTMDEIISHWFREDGSSYQITNISQVKEGAELHVAVTTLSEPRCFIKDGKITGLNVELLDRIAYELGMKAVYQDMSFSAMIDSLSSGKSEVIAAMYDTPEREKQVDFTAGYLSNPVVLLAVKTDVAGNVTISSRMNSLKDSFYRTFIVEDRYKLILQGLWTTVVISILSVVLGSLLGAFVCAMRRSYLPVLSVIATIYVRLIQGVPIVLILMILYYILFAKVDIDPVLIAVIGFSINFAAYASEIFRTAVEATDKGQLEAAYALGFSKQAGFFKVTFRQALRHILPIYKGEFVSMVKMTSVVGYIAIQDLTKMSDIIRSRTFDAFFPLFMTAILYFIITWLFILVLGKVEQRIDPKRRKRIVRGIE